MKARELANLGVPKGETMRLAVKACAMAAKAQPGVGRTALRETVTALLADPESYRADGIWGPLAEAVLGVKQARSLYVPREEHAPWKQWGEDLEASAVEQLRNACELPVAVAGALMPDAHQGYGLPIGGVLATDNAVIPFAVGVDIACRMKLTVLDLPVSALDRPARTGSPTRWRRRRSSASARATGGTAAARRHGRGLVRHAGDGRAEGPAPPPSSAPAAAATTSSSSAR